MTQLLFTLRKSQLKRRLSQVQMNQMNVASQLQRVTSQISSAQQAKAAKAQLFGSTMRQNGNAIQTMFGLSHQQKMFLANQEMFSKKQDFDKINHYATYVVGQYIKDDNGCIKIDNIKEVKEKCPEIYEVLKKYGADDFEDSGKLKAKIMLNASGQIVDKDGQEIAVNKDFVLNMIFQTLQMQNQSNVQDYFGKQMDLQNDYIDMQKVMNTQTFMTNTFNLVNDFIDGNELESLNALQTQLQATKDALDTEAAQIKTELEATEKAEEEARKKDAPKY